jgi:predicted RND superfamily exporter protein
VQLLARLYLAFVLDRPWFALALLAILAGLAGAGARDFRLDASSDSLVVETDPDLAFFRRVSARYGGSEFLIVTYEPQGDLFSDASIATLRALQDDIEAVDGVDSVLGMLDVPLLRSPPVPIAELADNIRTLTSAGTDRALARQELTTSPLYADLVVSTDGRATALQVNLPRDERYADLVETRNALLVQRSEAPLSEAEAAELERVSLEFEDYKRVVAARQRQLIADVRAAIEPYRAGALVHLGGVPMIADDMLRFVRGDLRTFGVGVLLLILATLAFFFRRPRWVLLPLAASTLVTLYMIGLLGAVGWPVTVISSNFVSLLIIISISLNIHLIVRFRELLYEDPERDKRELIEATVRDKFWPCFYTALTTMVAFGSLVTSGIVPVIDFGWMMTIGVAVALVVAFLLFPAALVLLPKGRPAGTLGKQVDATEALGRFTANSLWRPVGLSLLLASAAGVGIARLSVESSFIDYFDEETEIHAGMTYVDEHLGGTTPLDVLIDFPEIELGAGADDAEDPFADPFAEPLADGSTAAGGAPAEDDPFADPFADPLASEDAGSDDDDRYWFTPDKIALIERVQAYLEAQPETGKVVSLATLHAIAKGFNDGVPLSGPELVIVIGAIPEQFRDTLLRPYAAPEANQARLTVRMIESNPELERDAFLERVRTHIAEDLGVGADRVELTSFMVLFNNMLQSLYTSQLTTVLWVGAGILLTFVVLFRSPLLGVLALIPNALAAAMVLGIMGWAGLPLDLMTITIAAIVIGIGVDDTIHYVHRYGQELARSGDYRAALHGSHASIGHAMYYTSLTVIAGFSILTLSNFNPTIYFGALTALSMAIALLANLTLLPALLVLARPTLRT